MLSNSLASSSEVSNVAFSNFYSYGVLIAGVFVGVAVIIIIIAIIERIYHAVTGHNTTWTRSMSSQAGWDQRRANSAPNPFSSRNSKKTWVMYETEPYKRRNVNKFNRDY